MVVRPFVFYLEVELILRIYIIGRIILLTLGNRLHSDGLDIVC